MSESKVLAVLLEGSSDRLTFEDPLKLYLASLPAPSALSIEVFRGDPTINDLNGDPIDSNEVTENVSSFIQSRLREEGFAVEDVAGIIQIGDLDAAFCDDVAVKKHQRNRVFYDEEKQTLFTRDVASTIERNHRKQDSLRTLMSMDYMELTPRCRVPYRYLYLSINLEHSFYGKPNCTRDEKDAYAAEFGSKYANSVTDWTAFIRALNCIGETYPETCKAARDPSNAFKALSNLWFLFEFVDELAESLFHQNEGGNLSD